MFIDKNIGIYIITNAINGKFYIGSSSDIQQRFYNHKSKLLNKTHVNLHLQNSVNKHGFENFKFQVLANCPFENLDSLEQWYVDNLKPHYNIRKFVESNRGIVLKEEHKEKISNSMIGKFCKPVLQYTKQGELVKEWESLTEAQIEGGFLLSKISACCKGNRKSHGGFLWIYGKENPNKRIPKNYNKVNKLIKYSEEFLIPILREYKEGNLSRTELKEKYNMGNYLDRVLTGRIRANLQKLI